MGSAMARALARSGEPPILWNRSAAAAESLAAELGTRVAATPAAVAAEADVCLTMLADDAAVEEVWRGPDGLLSGARSGAVLIDLSTVSPSVIRSLEPDARAAGVGILDAPVSGSVAFAEAGRLTIMVGAEAADLERARPVLERLATKIFHLGAVGSGAAMKLAVNTVIYGLNEAVSEALVLAERAGIDRSAAYEVLEGSAVAAPFVGYKKAAYLDPVGAPAAFSVELAEKDLRLITALAAELGVPMPQAGTNREVLKAVMASGQGAADFSTVAEHLRHRERAPALPVGAGGVD
jgi:3-hydroxyisobutyrate dehydrogenase/2-hydroxy-3-oxopropionate reductase